MVPWRPRTGVADYRRLRTPWVFGMIFLYIDPGAGSMVIQAVIAGALAIPFFFRTHVGRAIARVRGLFGRRDSTTPTS